MVLVVADAHRADAVSRDLVELGAPGYTEVPVIEGAGHSGVHRGDRVHPGAVVMFFAVVPDERSGAIFDGLVRRRDAAGDDISRLFMLPVERQA
jgi:hypothetical protein